LDPLGFGLENFDATGAWRASDDGHPIDARGDLPDGRKFDGPAGLKAMLKSDGAFTRCLALKLATYALGRGLSKEDEASIEGVVRALGAAASSAPAPSSSRAGTSSSPTLQELIEAIVASEPFRTRTLSKGS
jgi:hypothetical protein